MKIILPLVAVSITLLIAGCSDPAANVTPAEVKSVEAATTPEPVTTSPAKTGKIYTLAPESKIGFTGSKVTGSHDGGFKSFKGMLAVTDGKLISNHTFEIHLTSTWADNDKPAGHLMSPDFFNVEKFPVATFKSTSITQEGDQHKVTGTLDLHGVTKEISFPATIAITDQQVTVKSEFSLNRFDFDIKYPGRKDDLIREAVVIRLDLVAKPAA